MSVHGCLWRFSCPPLSDMRGSEVVIMLQGTQNPDESQWTIDGQELSNVRH